MKKLMSFLAWLTGWSGAVIFFMVCFIHEQKFTMTWGWNDMPASFTSRQIVAEIWAAAWFICAIISLVGMEVTMQLGRIARDIKQRGEWI